jgi:hypothetical protein
MSLSVLTVITAMTLTVASPVGWLAQDAKPEKKAVPSVAGAWKMPVQTPHGRMDARFDVVVDAKDPKKVTGTIAFGQGEPMKVAGEFADGTLQFKTVDASMELSFTGTLKDADTMPGFISSHTGDLQGTATRVKPVK